MRQSRVIGFQVKTKQFHHGNRADFCVYADGTITRTWKKSMVEEKVKPFISHGKLTVKCGGRQFIVKHLVASAFLKDYQKGASVICVDGNNWNCCEENLCVVPKKMLGRITGWKARSQGILIKKENEKNFRAYRSIREAAKALNCSYQTLIDYINSKNKHSILEGVQFII